jgi:hypothetical protein
MQRLPAGKKTFATFLLISHYQTLFAHNSQLIETNRSISCDCPYSP